MVKMKSTTRTPSVSLNIRQAKKRISRKKANLKPIKDLSAQWLEATGSKGYHEKKMSELEFYKSHALLNLID